MSKSKEAMYKRRGKTWQKNYEKKSDDEKEAIYLKASKAQKEYWANLTTKDRRKRTQNSRKYKANMSQKERNTLGRKISNIKDNWSDMERNEFSKNNSLAQIKLNKGRTPEEKARVQRNAALGRVKSLSKYIVRNGHRIYFDSTWEIGTYKTLEDLNLAFWYINEEGRRNGKVFDLRKKMWHPDFILKWRKLIIEVKGYPLAESRFWDIELPLFKKYFRKEYSVTLCKFNPINWTFDSIEDFFNNLDWTHIAPKHKSRYNKYVS